MKTNIILLLCLGFVLVPGIIFAQEVTVDEDEVFSDEDTVIALEEKVDEGLSEELNQEAVTFSGEISTNFEYTITRNSLDGDADFADNPYSTSIEGDFLLDIRLTEGIKSFGDVWVAYSPQEDENDSWRDENAHENEHLETILREFFVDVNIARKIYLRAGKQTLKWGRGYLWNPTDLISEDRKDFEDIDARREGVYGLKMHVPFGTTWNVYGFLNASGAETVDEFAAAGKVEVLLPKDIEMAVSMWKKQDYFAVYGLDFKTYKYSMYWWSELSVSPGDNRHRLEVNELPTGLEYVDSQVTDEWIPRVCLGFNKSFDFRDLNDRISVTGEFYYNHSGYDDNMLEDEKTRTRFIEGGYYEPGNYGKFYMAFFSSYREFLSDDMTLNLKAIGNLNDSSFTVSSGVEYQFAFDARLHVDVNAYLGAENCEYTVDGNALSTKAEIQIVF